MAGTVDSVEYEQFDYHLYDQDPMPLEDAIKKASEFRAKDAKHFYRVVPANRDKTRFKVDSVRSEELQANIFSRWMAKYVNTLFLNYLRRNG